MNAVVSSYPDGCPICTEGLRRLVALLDSVESPAEARVRKLKASQQQVSERLALVFGSPVDAAGIKFELDS